jgi:hypothetical protein
MPFQCCCCSVISDISLACAQTEVDLFGAQTAAEAAPVVEDAVKEVFGSVESDKVMLSVHYLCTICALSVHSLYTLCTLSVHSLC